MCVILLSIGNADIPLVILEVIVSFTERQYNASEGDGSMRVGLRLSRSVDLEISVGVAFQGVSASGVNVLNILPAYIIN